MKIIKNLHFRWLTILLAFMIISFYIGRRIEIHYQDKIITFLEEITSKAYEMERECNYELNVWKVQAYKCCGIPLPEKKK